MTFSKKAAILASVVGLSLASGAQAATMFTGTGLPQANAVFAGGSTTATFTGPNQSFTSYTENGITISDGRISSDYIDSYNTFGSSYDNNQGNLNTITFTFANAVNAFAFNWGAADYNWNVNLLAGGTSLGNFTITPTYGSNAKEYFGFTGTGITSAVLSLPGGAGDFVFVDNLTVSTAAVEGAVPEPSTWALMFAGLGVVGFALRRRQPVRTTVRFA